MDRDEFNALKQTGQLLGDADLANATTEVIDDQFEEEAETEEVEEELEQEARILLELSLYIGWILQD